MSGAARDEMSRPLVEEIQAERLRRLLDEILPANAFWRERFATDGVDPKNVRTPADLRALPCITKAELLADQEACPPYGNNRTFPVERYSRLSQTSGTSGRPLRWIDTPESWEWMLGCWRRIFAIVGVTAKDRLFFPFSFGPFLGFWTAFEAASRLGWFCVPAGGMSTGARLRLMLDNACTVVFCTPTYALHLAEAATHENIDLAACPVRALIVAGEPGGNIPATRQRIEIGWGARVFDHAGMTEVGPASIECPENPGGLHLLETDYIADIVDSATTIPVQTGIEGELVLTNLGRTGSPLFRYRTGDLVRADPKPCPCGRTLLRLDGGILGRADDMIHLRGNNVHPAALEAILRRFDDVVEYRIEVDRSAALPVLRIDVEGTPDVAERVDRAIRDELLFRAEVRSVAPGSLPRFEMKARRVVVK